MNMSGNRVGTLPITPQSIVELQGELYVALALRAIDQTEIEVELYARTDIKRSVINSEAGPPPVPL